MIKTFILGLLLNGISLSAPVLAQSAPAMAASSVGISSNADCRERARSGFVAMKAAILKSKDNDSQFARIREMTVLVWCQNKQALIVAAGANQEAVNGLMNQMQNALIGDGGGWEDW